MATITGLSASTINPGQTLTISGTEFGANQGPNQVFLGDVICTVTSWGDTSIAVTVPADAPSGEVYVKFLYELDGGFVTVTNAPVDVTC